MKACPTRLAIARPPAALDDVGDRARGAQVVEDRLAGVLGQHRLGDERRDEVARDELARVVDEEAAIGVAVPGDAEVGADALHLADDELAVLLQQRVRLIVRERAVRVEVAALGAQREAIEDRLHHRARHAVGAVQHDLQRRDRRGVDDREAALGEALQHVALPALPLGLGRAELALERPVAHLLDAAVAAQRQRAATHDLHAVVLLGVVRGGHDQTALVAVLADGVVEHLGADETDVVDVAARVERRADRRLAQLCRGQPHVAADRHRARLELVDVGAHDAVHAVGVEFVGHEAPYVVGLEDRRVERHGRNPRRRGRALRGPGGDERRARLQRAAAASRERPRAPA